MLEGLAEWVILLKSSKQDQKEQLFSTKLIKCLRNSGRHHGERILIIRTFYILLASPLHFF